MYAAAPHGPELIEVEECVFEFNHAQLGAHLLATWGLPQPVVAAIANHHNHPEKPDPLQDIVYAGNLLSDLLCDPETGRLEAAAQFLMDRFQMDSDGLMDLAADSVNDVEESASLFGAGRGCTIHESVLDAVRELISTSGLATVEV